MTLRKRVEDISEGRPLPHLAAITVVLGIIIGATAAYLVSIAL
jgi:hypothetical protein